MAKFVIMSMVFAVVLLKSAAAQTVHVVGDSMGWVVPNNGGAGAFETWAASKKFVVGDILTFNFGTGRHDVQQVPKASYDACTASNPIGTLITTGPANITLDSAGDHYYICTFSQHCQLGQKLSISVSAAAPGASPSPTPPTTPSPHSGTPDDCTPAPTTGPTANSPRGSTFPSGPTNIPESSSPAVLASVLVPVMAVIMGLFF
ncbi:hypothetical protein ACOSQ2_021201 [Xanthoceras sorbifolium]|uniref:Phytocyanin domain-containing protein n=1 Tax=Xanthoceras sorbifolium TaxID=99658 RepID=A0ABQ8HL12_9ROSI|nr:hypothetical protein JRO89_XS09G0117400 [Xanthoceras sorbifolium]